MEGFAKFKFGILPARPKRVPWDRQTGQSGNLRLRPAQSESTRQAEAIGQEQEYVTVDAGSDLIVSLTKAYVEK